MATNTFAVGWPKVLIMLLCLSIGACGRPQATYPEGPQGMAEILEQTLASLNIVDPVSDMTVNLDADDTRFLGTYGYVCAAPGVRESDFQLHGTHGMNCLAGTSDAVESAKHMHLIQMATEYARRYNIALAEHLRKSGNP